MYNKRAIMKAAWKAFKKGADDFRHCLRVAWINAKLVLHAKALWKVNEEVHSWYGWKQTGNEVQHGSKALFTVEFLDDFTKSGFRKVPFFGVSQVQPVAE